MYSSVLSATISGVEGVPVLVEADVSNGLPVFSMVGYLSSRVREAQERVWTALRNTGLSFPPKRITVNLSPADIRKEGPDLTCLLQRLFWGLSDIWRQINSGESVWQGNWGLTVRLKEYGGSCLL